jgi:hypothetical protein
VIAAACYRHATRGGGLALVLYDVTTPLLRDTTRGRAA